MRTFEEKRLSIAQVARLERVHPGTVFRWITNGLRGGRLKLEACKRGGRLFTTLESVERFHAKLSSDKVGPHEQADPSGREAAGGY